MEGEAIAVKPSKNIFSLLACLLALAFAAQLLPVEGHVQRMAGIMLSEPAPDAEEGGDNEWEKSPKNRHSDNPAWGRDARLAPDPALARRAPAGAPIGDRGADHIPTPPPDGRA